MKKTNPLEMSLKKYSADFRQLRKLWSDSSYQVHLSRQVPPSKQKCLSLKRFIEHDSQLISMLQDIQQNGSVQQIRCLHKLKGYVLQQLQNNKKHNFKFCLILVYEFGSCTLAEFQQKRLITDTNKDYLPFLQSLPTLLLRAFSELESNKGINTSSILLDHQFISIDHYRQLQEEFKLCYFPFEFVKEHKVKHLNFDQGCYSAKELRLINRNRNDKPHIPSRIEVAEVILESERETEGSNCNLELLRQMGLLVLKTMYEMCSNICLNIPKLELYCMNQQFDIDYNWSLIGEFLEECEKERDYQGLTQQVRYMIKDCREQKSFREYLSDITNMHHTNRVSEEEETLERNMPNIEEYLRQNRLFSFEDKGDFDLLGKEQGDKERDKIREIESLLKLKEAHQIVYEDKSKYRGELREGQREGLGIYTFAEGDIFGGEWKNGMMSGKGFYYFTNHERYEGQILEGLKHGPGTYFYRNGDYYKGDWNNDVKEGQGEFYTSSTQQLYRGEFKNNFKDGWGTIVYPNGEKFEGHFWQGMKQGEGSLFDGHGHLYLKGKWKNDSIVGNVQMFMPNNDYYLGEMVRNKKHGKGIYKYSNGTVYEGDFVGDSQTGKCRIEYGNGDTYEGEVREGRFHGCGKYTYKKEGVVYEGQWKENNQEGAGKYCYQGLQMGVQSKGNEVKTYSLIKECSV